jgi:ribonuclease VapC
LSFLDIARRFGTVLDETEWDAYRDFGKGSGHPAGLNFGDCFAYALAKVTGEPLLFKGADFGHTDILPAIA